MKWFPYIFTAVVLIAIGGVFSYLDYQTHGFTDIGKEFHPELPEEKLLEDTTDNSVYVPPVETEKDLGPRTSDSNAPQGYLETEKPTVEETPPSEIPSPNSPATPEEELKLLFTSKGISDILVRQNLGTTQKIFDLISIDASAGTFRVYDLTMKGASLRAYVLSSTDSSNVFQYITNAARLEGVNNGIQVARLDKPYGDEFAYVNVQNDATTVRALMRLDNQVIGLQYARTAHGTVSTFLNAYKK